jgi:hypothetical protein
MHKFSFFELSFKQLVVSFVYKVGIFFYYNKSCVIMAQMNE